MIAEHEFITTFEQHEAIEAAAMTLHAMGFTVRTYEARIVAKRGEDKPAKAKRERQLPQSVELTFDRGRCHLAASIFTKAKPKPLHRRMIKTALTTLERVLVHGQSDDEALEQWRQVNGEAGVRASQYGGARGVIFWVLVGILCLLLLSCFIGFIVAIAGP